MNDLIKDITSRAALFNGRYEYREMHVVIQKMEKGEEVFDNATKLRKLVDNFACVSTYEIQIRKSLLSSIDELLNYSENVQPSKAKDATNPGKTETDTDLQDETNVDNREGNSSNGNEPESSETGVNEQSSKQENPEPPDDTEISDDFENIPSETETQE